MSCLLCCRLSTPLLVTSLVHASVKSRKSFVRTVTPLDSSASSSRLGFWKDSLTDVPASVKMGLEVAESLPVGSGEDWLCWRALNRLRTGVGRAKTVMMRWGYLDDAQSVDCDCGEPQTMAQPPLLPSTRRGLHGWWPGHSDTGMRPQVGENNCVKDTKEEVHASVHLRFGRVHTAANPMWPWYAHHVTSVALANLLKLTQKSATPIWAWVAVASRKSLTICFWLVTHSTSKSYSCSFGHTWPGEKIQIIHKDLMRDYGRLVGLTTYLHWCELIRPTSSSTNGWRL